jgi:hypothetical protein
VSPITAENAIEAWLSRATSRAHRAGWRKPLALVHSLGSVFNLPPPMPARDIHGVLEDGSDPRSDGGVAAAWQVPAVTQYDVVVVNLRQTCCHVVDARLSARRTFGTDFLECGGGNIERDGCERSRSDPDSPTRVMRFVKPVLVCGAIALDRRTFWRRALATADNFRQFLRLMRRSANRRQRDRLARVMQVASCTVNRPSGEPLTRALACISTRSRPPAAPFLWRADAQSCFGTLPKNTNVSVASYDAKRQ